MLNWELILFSASLPEFELILIISERLLCSVITFDFLRWQTLKIPGTLLDWLIQLFQCARKSGILPWKFGKSGNFESSKYNSSKHFNQSELSILKIMLSLESGLKIKINQSYMTNCRWNRRRMSKHFGKTFKTEFKDFWSSREWIFSIFFYLEF